MRVGNKARRTTNMRIKRTSFTGVAPRCYEIGMSIQEGFHGKGPHFNGVPEPTNDVMTMLMADDDQDFANAIGDMGGLRSPAEMIERELLLFRDRIGGR
jgi:hypothetical protein